MNLNDTRTLKSLTPLVFYVLALCGLNLPANAQHQQPWYQIEIIIFENRGYSPYGPDAETWPRDILPAYPLNSRHLLSPEELKELEAQEQADTLTTAGDSMAASEKAFVDLGEDFAQLKRVKNSIDRERDMRVIFHKVWRQPVGNSETTPSVIVQGGNRYDDHHELEGSVQVTVSRYLHLDARLWFTSFEANTGQEDSWWPNLPTPPARSLNPDSTAEFLQQDASKLSSTSPPWQNADRENSNMRFGLNTSWENENQQKEKQKNYVTKEIITFDQSRRMRSGELHYLDHPKLGIIVRIDNYKTEAELEMQETGVE